MIAGHMRSCEDSASNPRPALYVEPTYADSAATSRSSETCTTGWGADLPGIGCSTAPPSRRPQLSFGVSKLLMHRRVAKILPSPKSESSQARMDKPLSTMRYIRHWRRIGSSTSLMSLMHDELTQGLGLLSSQVIAQRQAADNVQNFDDALAIARPRHPPRGTHPVFGIQFFLRGSGG
jgi:hypothetical protein